MELKGTHFTFGVGTQRLCSQQVSCTYRDHSLPRLSVEAQLLLLQVLTEWGLDVYANVGNSAGGRVQDK